MTRLYLAGAEHFAQGMQKGYGWGWTRTDRKLDGLVSYFYIKQWRDAQAAGVDLSIFGNLMLDSGAYSAWNSGKPVDIVGLSEETKRSEWHESVGLDVIGDSAGSRANLDMMRTLGSPAYPVFHIGDPWDDLAHYCAHWQKVGLSCRFGEPLKESVRFLEQCFARAWPHRFHSFGWTQYDVLQRFPFHSADSATWIFAAMNRCLLTRRRGNYGRTKPFLKTNEATKKKLAQRNVETTMDMADELMSRWRTELKRFDEGETT